MIVLQKYRLSTFMRSEDRITFVFNKLLNFRLGMIGYSSCGCGLWSSVTPPVFTNKSIEKKARKKSVHTSCLQKYMNCLPSLL